MNLPYALASVKINYSLIFIIFNFFKSDISSIFRA